MSIIIHIGYAYASYVQCRIFIPVYNHSLWIKLWMVITSFNLPHHPIWRWWACLYTVTCRIQLVSTVLLFSFTSLE
ncbi:hypothetical protein BDB00DRAFT_806710 [Zychaea mexicana]|uniref:uncharacterized protein n=1 Tax=Zychaea mexicana TaxID=64656 RepID=UPI0022FE812B|nr:uncharacterized protein BDB00DRAFT_806710 [Zychaea mexicana]KAI9497086.1 hypothetical protein BDB00DRAFT_806710 [Zychaea mexicana]